MAENINNQEIKNQQAEGGFSLKELWEIFILNWQWVILSTIVCLGLAVVYLRYKSPVYSTGMKILVKDDKSNNKYSNGMMNLEDMGIISNSNGFDNELEILQSTNINTRVVKNLKLYVSYKQEGKIKKHEQYHNNPIIVDMPQHQLEVLKSTILLKMDKKDKGLIVEGKVYNPGENEPRLFTREIKKLPSSMATPGGTIILQLNPGVKLEDRTQYAQITPLELAGRAYAARLSASATSKTTTVAQLTFTDTQKQRSIDYLNELLRSYNEDANEDKNEVAQKTEDFISERLGSIRSELDVTEGGLEEYKKTNDLINLTNDATTALASTTEYQKQQVELQTQINLIDALANYMDNPSNQNQVIPANLGLDNQNLNTTIGKYNDFVLQRNRLLKSSSEDNPYVQRITAVLEEMWPSIRMSLNAIKSDIRTQKKSADDQYTRYNTRINSTPTQERVLTNMSRQQEIQANLYLMLLQKREENFISLHSVAAKARSIDSPQVNGQISPKRSVILLGALVFGFGFPIGLIYLLGLMRYQIEGRQDIEKLTKISVLADIPLGDKSVDGESALVVRENSNNMMEEAFRGLRTNLRFIISNDEKVIMVTSCIPGEGKSFVATNLAMSLALMDKKVVILGLDIRKPRLVKLFGLPATKKGITTLLASNEVSAELVKEQISSSGIHSNLDILPAGVIPPNPGELISRKQLEMVIEILKESYDYIVLDTPPIGLVSDTLSLARVANMTLFVCRADYSPRSNFELINNLQKDEKMAKINLVLNGVDLKKKKYGYYYGYGKYGRYGKYGKYGYGKYGYGKYGHYGIYGNYSSHESKEHTEK